MKTCKNYNTFCWFLKTHKNLFSTKSVVMGYLCQCWVRLRMRIVMVALGCLPDIQTSIVRNRRSVDRCCIYGFTFYYPCNGKLECPKMGLVLRACTALIGLCVQWCVRTMLEALINSVYLCIQVIASLHSSNCIQSF